MITGLPGESDEDVTESIELLEKLKKHNCFLFVLPFISMGGLRNENNGGSFDRYLDDSEIIRRELLKKGTIKSANTAPQIKSSLVNGVKFPRNVLLGMMIAFAARYIKRHLS